MKIKFPNVHKSEVFSGKLPSFSSLLIFVVYDVLHSTEIQKQYVVSDNEFCNGDTKRKSQHYVNTPVRQNTAPIINSLFQQKKILQGKENGSDIDDDGFVQLVIFFCILLHHSRNKIGRFLFTAASFLPRLSGKYRYCFILNYFFM